jgi:hypothetical protein
MKLGFHNQATSHFEVIRDLTSEELETHKNHTKVVTEARNRLALFRMLERNYHDFRSFVAELVSLGYQDQDTDGEELDRHILNYLTFAYSIQQHFEVSFGRRFRKKEKEKNDYSDFLDRMCARCWPFAFILDFRGYVQHVGLAVGSYKRNVSHSSVEVKITADPVRLVRESRQWERSKLNATSDPIDLVKTLHEFHIQMLQSYGSFVATTFFPELVPASEFYANLTEEAKRKDSSSRMVFFLKQPDVIHEQGGKIRVNAQLAFAPNSLFEELGITRPPAKPNKSVEATPLRSVSPLDVVPE